MKPKIVGFINVDWAGDPLTKRSIAGYFFNLG